MTRTLTTVSILLFMALIASIIVGFASVAPAMLLVGLLCAFPLFMLAFGATLGRMSSEMAIVRKEPAPRQSVNRVSSVSRSDRRVPDSLSG